VPVISGRTNTVVADVSVGFGGTGIAVDPKTNTIYFTNRGADMAVISGRTNTVTATIPVGGGLFGVAANPKTNTAYVANPGNNTVDVLAPCPK